MDADRPLLHICHAPADGPWVLGWLIPALGLRDGQCSTREQDGLGELQIEALAGAVERSPLTLLIASGATRDDRLAQLGAALAQHAGIEAGAPRLIVLVRDRALLDAGDLGLPLAQRALVWLDVSDEDRAEAAVARLRVRLALPVPVEHRPACPYPGLAPFTAANRGLLCGREAEQDDLVRRIGGGQHALVVGPSGCGKSSLIHAAVLPGLEPGRSVMQVVPRGDRLASALRAVVAALEAPGLATALDGYVAEIRGATDAQVDAARARLAALAPPDPRRRVVVIDPLEEVFAEDDAGSRQALFTLLSGLWIVPWCTVVLCMRTEFYGLLLRTRWWRELEASRYLVEPLDDAGLRRAITVPARRAGVHVDGALVERLLREIDRDRSSEPLPLLQVALKELWAHLRWRYLAVADYERIVDRDQRGLAAVLAAHADGVLQRLAPDDQVIAQRVLLDLVHLGEGRPDTRRRRAVGDLRRGGDAPGQLARVLGALIEGRLVTTGDEAADRRRAHRAGSAAREVSRPGRHVDLAHDALITRWPALAGWIDEHRDELGKQRALEARAANPGLLTPAELPEFVRWLRWTASPAGQLLGASDALRDLVRRSQRSRRKRAAFRWGLLAASIAIAAGFAAQAQQLRAERDRARQSTSSAMELVGTIVFEIERELHRFPGTSAIRARLLAQSRALVGRLRALGDLPDAEQRIASVAKLEDAALALERGHLQEALALHREVLAEVERRAWAAPANPEWQRDLALTYDLLGDIAMRVGKLDEARDMYLRGLAVCEMFWAPGSPGWRRDRAASYANLGTVARITGNLDEARGWYERALEARKALADEDPHNAEWQRELLVAADELGGLALRMGRLDTARLWHDRFLALAQALERADPSDAQRQLDLAAAYETQSEAALARGQLDEADRWIEQAIAIQRRLAGADHSNTVWQSALARSYKQRGEVAIQARRLADARSWLEQAIAIRGALATADPSNASWQRDLAATYERRGEVELRADARRDAYPWYKQAWTIRRDAAIADPSNGECQRDLSEVLVMVAQTSPDPHEVAATLFEARAIYDGMQRAALFRGDAEFERLGPGLEQLVESCTASAQ